MRIMKVVLFLSMLICGCATGTQKTGQGSAQEEESATSLRPIREALHAYNGCLQQNVKPYLNSKAKPASIADTVAGSCEPQLAGYKTAVRNIYAKALNPNLKEYPVLVQTKPEKHADRVREKGKRATIAKVLSARESKSKRAKTAAGSKQ
jgi:hypothetical protein